MRAALDNDTPRRDKILNRTPMTRFGEPVDVGEDHRQPEVVGQRLQRRFHLVVGEEGHQRLLGRALDANTRLAVLVGTRKAMAMAVHNQDTSRRQTLLQALLAGAVEE